MGSDRRVAPSLTLPMCGINVKMQQTTCGRIAGRPREPVWLPQEKVVVHPAVPCLESFGFSPMRTEHRACLQNGFVAFQLS